jgi:hypothetical protein
VQLAEVAECKPKLLPTQPHQLVIFSILPPLHQEALIESQLHSKKGVEIDAQRACAGGRSRSGERRQEMHLQPFV